MRIRRKGEEGKKGLKRPKRLKANVLLHGSHSLPLHDSSIDDDVDMDLKLQTSNSGLVGTKDADGHTLHLMA